MKITILGAAAGGAFPQWNANHEACRLARQGLAKAASQASICVSSEPGRWVVVNASPDLRYQIEATPALHPQTGLRSSPIAAVLLTNADVDAVAGLLNLREGTPFALYAHRKVLENLAANPIFDVVNQKIVPRRQVAMNERFEMHDADGRSLGLKVEAFPAPGKIPLYREAEVGWKPNTASEEGDTLGLVIEGGGRRIVYLANCARITDELKSRIEGADLLFMDGTLWHDDEMIRLGVGQKTGKRMGHISMSGDDGAMAQLANCQVGRKIFIHINNTNPALLPNSAERKELAARGWEVAEDGITIEL